MYNQYRIVNEIPYIWWETFKFCCVSNPYSTSRFTLGTFQALSNHLGLGATVLDSTALDCKDGERGGEIMLSSIIMFIKQLPYTSHSRDLAQTTLRERHPHLTDDKSQIQRGSITCRSHTAGK